MDNEGLILDRNGSIEFGRNLPPKGKELLAIAEKEGWCIKDFDDINFIFNAIIEFTCDGNLNLFRKLKEFQKSKEDE